MSYQLASVLSALSALSAPRVLTLRMSYQLSISALYPPPFRTVAQIVAGDGAGFSPRFGALHQLVSEATVEIAHLGSEPTLQSCSNTRPVR